MTTKRIQPERLFQRALKGHTLYSHVVIGSIARVHRRPTVPRQGGKYCWERRYGCSDTPGRRDLRIALEAAGLGLTDLVKTTTYVTDIDEFFKHPEIRAEIFGIPFPQARQSKYVVFLIQI